MPHFESDRSLSNGTVGPRRTVEITLRDGSDATVSVVACETPGVADEISVLVTGCDFTAATLPKSLSPSEELNGARAKEAHLPDSNAEALATQVGSAPGEVQASLPAEPFASQFRRPDRLAPLDNSAIGPAFSNHTPRPTTTAGSGHPPSSTRAPGGPGPSNVATTTWTSRMADSVEETSVRGEALSKGSGWRGSGGTEGRPEAAPFRLTAEVLSRTIEDGRLVNNDPGSGAATTTLGATAAFAPLSRGIKILGPDDGHDPGDRDASSEDEGLHSAEFDQAKRYRKILSLFTSEATYKALRRLDNLCKIATLFVMAIHIISFALFATIPNRWTNFISDGKNAADCSIHVYYSVAYTRMLQAVTTGLPAPYSFDALKGMILVR